MRVGLRSGQGTMGPATSPPPGTSQRSVRRQNAEGELAFEPLLPRLSSID